MMDTIFNHSHDGQHAYSLPKKDDAWTHYHPPASLTRKQSIPLPETNELQLLRHYSQLARRNMGIDTNFYPLGSCTMKYNPRIAETCAALPSFCRSHPLAPDDTVQGNLQIACELIAFLCELCGMDGGSLLPNAGAQGEFAGIAMIAAYHHARNDHDRTDILIPDSAHGTNPASAKMAGFNVITIPSTADGELDLNALKKALSPNTAGLMLTNPSTLGLFSRHIVTITELVHTAGGLLYYDGANLNAILELVRPGDMGFDVMHLNLHKTFATPHGGGGPGAGPILCQSHLLPYLPIPRISKDSHGVYRTTYNDTSTIGMLASFHGNFSIWLRAYLYARLHGHAGLRRIAEMAVLNANYLKKRLTPFFNIPYPQSCMHEFVLQADTLLDKDIHATDIAKRLLDYGFYAPTIYFPLIVKECMLIEPTETESLSTLDAFADAMISILDEAQKTPSLLKNAPHHQTVGRLDETKAARQPILKAF